VCVSARAAFSRQDTALLFHLKNHYALIFALRDWIVSDDVCTSEGGVGGGGRVVRQLLCARKGQRPTAWVEFEEARETMLSWEGHKIMAISLSPQSQSESESEGRTFIGQAEQDAFLASLQYDLTSDHQVQIRALLHEITAI
jgi:hypothetical protein